MSAPLDVGLGLGSNIGDKAGHIRAAAAALSRDGLVDEAELSPLYRTAPWGKLDQDWFVNACLVGRTRLDPLDLLAAVKALEGSLGRTASVRWGPRVIDIDLLFVGTMSMDTEALTLPHRDLANRAFVLVPLADLRPERRFGGETVAGLLRRVDRTGIERLDLGSA